MYSSAAKLKTSGKLTLCKDLFKSRHASKIGQTQQEEPKRQLLSIFYIRHWVFPLSRAAVVHLTHVIEGGSVETRGALNASPAALQRETVEFLVPALLPLWRPGVSLTCWWQLGARNNAVSWPQWIPWRFTVQKHWGFFQFLYSFPTFKGISST